MQDHPVRSLVRALPFLLLLASVGWAEPAAAGLQEEAAATGAPDWFKLLPPLVAIAAALALRSVIPALFLGVWLGGWGVEGLGFTELFSSLLSVFDTYVHGALIDGSHASVILFSLMIGGMVGIIMRNGGMQGIVDHITGWTNTSRRAQLATSWLGIGIFFDDYANSLVVGNTMRPVTDRLKISREKLAYLVDSTAAPVACILFVTTWIGMELGLIQAGLDEVGAVGVSAYDVFLSSLRFSFYPVLCLVFVLLVAYTGRDFGPMLAAERRARGTGAVLRPGSSVDEGVGERGVQAIEGKPHRALNAILPIGVMLLAVLVGMWHTGKEALQADGAEITLRNVVGAADSYAALLWGSLLGVLTASALSLGQRVLTLEQTVDAWYQGLRAMLYAMIVLVLAWALNGTTEALGTGEYLGELVGDSIPIGVLPAAVFLLSAAIAFATGTSWGTMGIIMPLVFPLTWNLLASQGIDNPVEHGVLLSVVSSVLAGAVWGDHCSPISDTTILSSMVSGCDHLDHVRTQLPYALTVGLVALGVGSIPCAYGVPWWVGMLGGAFLLFTLLRLLGRDPEAAT